MPCSCRMAPGIAFKFSAFFFARHAAGRLTGRGPIVRQAGQGVELLAEDSEEQNSNRTTPSRTTNFAILFRAALAHRP